MNTSTSSSAQRLRHGRNVKRLREILGIKQEELAQRMSLSQQTVSRLESQDELDSEWLDKFANALHVPVESIEDFREEAAYNVFSGTWSDHASNHAHYNTACSNSANYQPTFNPIDKIAELYERLLKSEQEKVMLLEQRLKEKQ